MLPSALAQGDICAQTQDQQDCETEEMCAGLPTALLKFILFYFCFLSHTQGAQSMLLAPCLGITVGEFGGTIQDTGN